jgi:shikimate dehydrogenase
MIDKYVVIGNPIGHSKSPLLFREFARQTGQEIHYETLLAPLDGFLSHATAFRADGGKGMNVTLPFKIEAFEFATHLTERARKAQAVNTLKFDGDEVIGDNTDGAGLMWDVTINLNFSIEGKKILIVGAGGAVRGIVTPILKERPKSLMISTRTVEKAQRLREQYTDNNFQAGGYSDIGGETFDLIINATSASLKNELPPLPPTVFADGSLAYDLVYGKGMTAFMRFAQDNGAGKTADGLGMLVCQAAESFLLWRSVAVETKPVIEKVSQLL